MSSSPLLAVRALLFNLYFYVWTALLCVVGLPALPFLSDRGVQAYARFWMRGIHAGLRVLVGLTYEVRGAERLPGTPAIMAPASTSRPGDAHPPHAGPRPRASA